LIAGHFPFLPRLLGALLTPGSDRIADFPQHGVVAVMKDDSDDSRETWKEVWRLPQHDAN
jgi:hypothetical protein